MSNEFLVNMPSLRVDSAAMTEQGAVYAGAMQPIVDLQQDSSWGDDMLTASLLREHTQAVSVAVEAHGLLHGMVSGVGNGMADMARTLEDADDTAVETTRRMGDEPWM